MKLIIGIIISAIVLGGTCEDGPIIEEPWGVIVEEEVVSIEVPTEQPHLTKQSGIFSGPSGTESWYNLDMTECIKIMRDLGYSEEEYPYWVRNDGCKMLGDYIMIAADTRPGKNPKGTIMETSMGMGIVSDHCVAATWGKVALDVAVCW